MWPAPRTETSVSPPNDFVSPTGSSPLALAAVALASRNHGSSARPLKPAWPVHSRLRVHESWCGQPHW